MNEKDSRAKQESKTKSPRVVAIVSGKGGTGKSIVIASVGYVLAHCGFRVLLIDTDLFTRGLSFYLVADEPYLAQVGINEFLLEDRRTEEVDRIRVSDKFTMANLFLIPSTANLKAYIPESQTVKKSMSKLMNEKLSLLVKKAMGPWKFDYILLDTRGGTDETTMGAVGISNGYILITEADKTSWDVSEVLLNAIESLAMSKVYRQVKKLGFILNKNTLPEKEVISFLQRRLGCRNLAVIPLDIEAVRCFQNDEVPVAKEITIPFSQSIITICKELFRSYDWDTEKKRKFDKLRESIDKERVKRERADRMQRMDERFIKIIGPLTVTITAIIAIYVSFRGKLSENAQIILIVILAYLASMAIVFSSSDRAIKLIKYFLQILRKH